jgi:hypothetical protein
MKSENTLAPTNWKSISSKQRNKTPILKVRSKCQSKIYFSFSPALSLQD